MSIIPFIPKYQSAVIKLILEIQTQEFGIDIDVDSQPDLKDIPNFYQQGKGNFWIALENDRVIGTIGLLDISKGNAALRKMFVDKAYRGHDKKIAQSLLNTLINWSKGQKMDAIYLGTTAKFLAAHRFYEKNKFIEIETAALPKEFPMMKVDSKFYYFKL